MTISALIGGMLAGVISTYFFPYEHWRVIMHEPQAILGIRILGGVVLAYHYGYVFIFTTIFNFALVHLYYSLKKITDLAINQNRPPRPSNNHIFGPVPANPVDPNLHVDLIYQFSKYRQAVEELQKFTSPFTEVILGCSFLGGALALNGVLRATVKTSPFLIFLLVADWIPVVLAFLAFGFFCSLSTTSCNGESYSRVRYQECGGANKDRKLFELRARKPGCISNSWLSSYPPGRRPIYYTLGFGCFGFIVLWHLC